MKTMLSAFRTTVSRGGEKPSYEMVFKFASMEDMIEANREWHAYRAALASTPQPASAETVEQAVAAERERCANMLDEMAAEANQSKLDHMQAGRKLVARDRDVASIELRGAAAAIRQSAKGGE